MRIYTVGRRLRNKDNGKPQTHLCHDVMVLRPSRLVDNGQVYHRPGRRRLFREIPALKQHL